MQLNVYVPKLAALPAIQPGTGIIGSPRLDHPGRLLIDYEDNQAEAINIRIMWNHSLSSLACWASGLVSRSRHLTGVVSDGAGGAGAGRWR